MIVKEQEKEIQSPLKKWTLLIYQAGDNNLNEECIYALKEMKKVGTWGPAPQGVKGPSLLNVVVQFDPAGRANSTRRFRIRGRGDDGEVEKDEIGRSGEIDTGDPQNLLDFLCHSIHENSTDYYMVVLGGHGAGVTEGFFLKDEERPLSSIPNSFPIPLLKEVFHSRRLEEVLDGRKINILGFDACMMSMVEMCYELRSTDTLHLALAAESFTLNSGWPLERVIETIKNKPNITPECLAEYVVKHYMDYYQDYFLGGVSVDQAVIDLDRIGYLKREIDGLAQAMIRKFKDEAPRRPWKIDDLKTQFKPAVVNEDEDEDDDEEEDEDEVPVEPERGPRPRYYYDEEGRDFQDAILLSHWAAQSYNGEQCVDLYDFCDLLQKRCPQEDHHNEESVWYACERVKEALRGTENSVIRKSCFSGASFQYSNGASLYFPWGQYDFSPTYRQLDFAKESDWTRFLKLYLKATKRRRRRAAEAQREKEDVRYTPPTNKGPAGMIFSMRNPPTKFRRMPCEVSSDCKKLKPGTNS
jgi:hypothetical protein